ncbi:unnamed protein product [Symbiodinium sp. CCMP2592]|nr:unnamed protein product [Symbiodinium sp. CCMP2592]
MRADLASSQLQEAYEHRRTEKQDGKVKQAKHTCKSPGNVRKCDCSNFKSWNASMIAGLAGTDAQDTAAAVVEINAPLRHEVFPLGYIASTETSVTMKYCNLQQFAPSNANFFNLLCQTCFPDGTGSKWSSTPDHAATAFGGRSFEQH